MNNIPAAVYTLYFKF